MATVQPTSHDQFPNPDRLKKFVADIFRIEALTRLSLDNVDDLDFVVGTLGAVQKIVDQLPRLAEKGCVVTTDPRFRVSRLREIYNNYVIFADNSFTTKVNIRSLDEHVHNLEKDLEGLLHELDFLENALATSSEFVETLAAVDAEMQMSKAD